MAVPPINKLSAPKVHPSASKNTSGDIPLLDPSKASKKRAGEMPLLQKKSPSSPLASRTVASSTPTDLQGISQKLLETLNPELKKAQNSLKSINNIKHASHFYKKEIQHLENILNILTKESKDPKAQILAFAEEIAKCLPEEMQNQKISKDSNETLKQEIQELKQTLIKSKTETLTPKDIKDTFQCFQNVQLMLGKSIRENDIQNKKTQEAAAKNNDMKHLLTKRVFQGAFWGGLLGTINYLLVQVGIITAGPTMGIGPVLALFAGVGINFLVFMCEFTKHDIDKRELAKVNKAIDPLIKQIADHFKASGNIIGETVDELEASLA